MPPKKITATYQIVTPMFLGDAEKKISGISPASFKGALRFWWRALNWGKYKKESRTDEEALQKLHKAEGYLFGKATEEIDNKTTGGQGAFLLRIVNSNCEQAANCALNNHQTYRLERGSWQSYMLGLGLMKYDRNIKHNVYIREAIISGSFTVELIYKNDDVAEKIKPALLLLGLLGGLGNRNRHGIGSISITKLTGEKIPQNKDELKKKLEKIINLPPTAENLPPYTAISQKTKIIISPETEDTAWQSLGTIAQFQQLYRGWGFRNRNGMHMINNTNADHNSHTNKQEDHDLVYEYVNGNPPPDSLPASSAFGFPKSYNLSSNPRKEIKLEPIAIGRDDQPDNNNKRSRRASPLFTHIHRFASNKTLTVQAFLPATLLPPQDKVVLKEKIDRRRLTVPNSTENSVWNIIDEYLRKDYFTKWQEVPIHG